MANQYTPVTIDIEYTGHFSFKHRFYHGAGFCGQGNAGVISTQLGAFNGIGAKVDLYIPFFNRPG